MKIFQQHSDGFLFFFPILAAVFALTACKKDPAPAPEPKPEETTAETSDKAPEINAPEQDPSSEANKEENTKDASQVADIKEAAEPSALDNTPQPDDKHNDLAINKECVVTHCNHYKGFENNGLECNTETIIEAGFALGDKAYAKNGDEKFVYTVGVKGRGDNCVDQGYISERCFIDQKSYVRYIIENQLICDYDGENGVTCLYDDDNHKNCKPKNLKFSLPKLRNTWADKPDGELSIDELEAKYIAFWGKRIECDPETTDSAYSCKSLESVSCHWNRTGMCYCPDGDPVTAGEFPDDICTKLVCNPLNSTDCREVIAACPDESPTEDEDADFEYKDLAIDPETCTVVHCKTWPGVDNDLECDDTKKILEANFVLGHTVYRVGHVERATKYCVHRGTIYDKCFLDKESYQSYIKENKMECGFEGDMNSKECINESPCIPGDDDDE